MEPTIGDALGEAILAHLNEAGSGLHVLERDDGWVNVMDAAVYFRRPVDWPTGEQIVLDHVRGAVLDIGSGAGRYAIELRDRGHEVLALDNSPGAIEACTRRGLTDVFAGDIHELPGQTTFDTFLLGGNNIGLLEDPRQALRVLDRLSSLARPGARIVGTYQPPTATADPDQLAYYELNRSRGRLAGQLRLRVRRDRIATPWFEYWFPDPEDLASVATEAGWQVTADEPIAFGNRLAILQPQP